MRMNFAVLPKIELHCHLDGSLRTDTVLEIARKEKIQLPTYDKHQLSRELRVPENCTSLVEYLNRFNIPIKIMQSKESLRRVAFELMEDAAKEGVKYIEIRFAPVLHTEGGLTIAQVIQNVIEGMRAGEKAFGIYGNIILSCLRHRGPSSAAMVIEAGKEFLGKGVVAIDLCGAEEEGFAKNFVSEIALAKAYGYRVTIHAGETGFASNVEEAVSLLGAERIGHGVSVENIREAYDLVKKKGILLEMCPTSNLHTKITKTYEEHPILKYFRDGIKVSFNTDNRTVSDTSVTNECMKINEAIGLTMEEYKIIYIDSVEAAFASEKVKDELKKLI